MTKSNKPSEYQENLDSLLEPSLKKSRNDDAKIIMAVRDILSQTITGKALLQWADTHNTQIMVDDQMPETHGALYRINNNIIALNDKIAPPLLACFLGHEIRHAWQDYKGFIHNSPYIPTGNLLITNRLVEADATAHHIQIAAELCMLNQYDAWNALENIAENDRLYQYSLKEYKDLAIKEEDSITDGRAMWRAFNEWFEPSTMGAYDDMILQKQKAVLLVHLKEHGNTAPILNIPIQHINYNDKDTLISLGHTLDGKRYFPTDLNDDYDKTGVFDIQNSLHQGLHELFHECQSLYETIPTPIIIHEKNKNINHLLKIKR